MSLLGWGRRNGVLIPGISATVVVVRDQVEVAAWPLEARGDATLALIEELARLQLAARRIGCTIRLRDQQPGFAALLELVGLVEVLGQAEDGEESGVEEVVEPDDPVA